MSFFGGGGFNGFGGRGFPRPQQHNQNARFGILPLMRPNQQMRQRMGGPPRGIGGGPPRGIGGGPPRGIGGGYRGGNRPHFHRGNLICLI